MYRGGGIGGETSTRHTFRECHTFRAHCSMFWDDIGHISQALFCQVPYYQAFDWDFVVDHQSRHRWYELQWLRMIDSQYWESVLCSHGVFDSEDMWFEHGYYQHTDSYNLGHGPDYYSDLVPRVLSTWDS